MADEVHHQAHFQLIFFRPNPAIKVSARVHANVAITLPACFEQPVTAEAIIHAHAKYRTSSRIPDAQIATSRLQLQHCTVHCTAQLAGTK